MHQPGSPAGTCAWEGRRPSQAVPAGATPPRAPPLRARQASALPSQQLCCGRRRPQAPPPPHSHLPHPQARTCVSSGMSLPPAVMSTMIPAKPPSTDPASSLSGSPCRTSTRARARSSSSPIHACATSKTCRQGRLLWGWGGGGASGGGSGPPFAAQQGGRHRCRQAPPPCPAPPPCLALARGGTHDACARLFVRLPAHYGRRLLKDLRNEAGCCAGALREAQRLEGLGGQSQARGGGGGAQPREQSSRGRAGQGSPLLHAPGPPANPAAPSRGHSRSRRYQWGHR